jgi:hypothetical protein
VNWHFNTGLPAYNGGKDNNGATFSFSLRGWAKLSLLFRSS